MLQLGTDVRQPDSGTIYFHLLVCFNCHLVNYSMVDGQTIVHRLASKGKNDLILLCYEYAGDINITTGKITSDSKYLVFIFFIYN